MAAKGAKGDINKVIEAEFKKLDTDSNGKIDRKELAVLVRKAFGMQPNVEVPDYMIDFIMKGADKDNSGAITKDELIGAVECTAILQRILIYSELFRILDKDQNGFLTKPELCQMVNENAKGDEKAKLNKEMEKIPKDIKISYQDFLVMCFALFN